jgi:hypothetical protein
VTEVVRMVRHRLVTPDGKLLHEEIQRADLQVWPPYVEDRGGTVYVRGAVQWWRGPWRHEVRRSGETEWRTVAEGGGGSSGMVQL